MVCLSAYFSWRVFSIPHVVSLDGVLGNGRQFCLIFLFVFYSTKLSGRVSIRNVWYRFDISERSTSKCQNIENKTKVNKHIESRDPTNTKHWLACLCSQRQHIRQPSGTALLDDMEWFADDRLTSSRCKCKMQNIVGRWWRLVVCSNSRSYARVGIMTSTCLAILGEKYKTIGYFRNFHSVLRKWEKRTKNKRQTTDWHAKLDVV